MEILNNFSMICCFISFVIGAVFMFAMLSIAAIYKDKEPMNKVHFYVARDKDKTLWLFIGKPIRFENQEGFIANEHGCSMIHSCCFKYLGLNTNDYKDLKWEDEPVEVFLNLED